MAIKFPHAVFQRKPTHTHTHSNTRRHVNGKAIYKATNVLQKFPVECTLNVALPRPQAHTLRLNFALCPTLEHVNMQIFH